MLMVCVTLFYLPLALIGAVASEKNVKFDEQGTLKFELSVFNTFNRFWTKLYFGFSVLCVDCTVRPHSRKLLIHATLQSLKS